MSTKKSENAEKLEADLVVLGGGGAGLAAAVSAAENGVKNIIVLEKRSVLGGNAAMAVGLFAVESKLQRRLGHDVSTGELFRLFMNYTHWKVDGRIVRAIINKSADSIQWLEDKGVICDYLSREFLKQTYPTFHINSKGRTGRLITKTLINDCEKMGVKLFGKAAAKKLLLDRSKKISGVLIETEGKEKEISTGSVIIATGGYAGNKELLKKYWPDFREDNIKIAGGILHTGDGLIMATDIGALPDARGALHMEGPDYVEGRHTMQIAAISHEPITIWLNKKGERFVDESNDVMPETGNALHRQLDGISYSLFDEQIKKIVSTEGTIRAGVPGIFASRGSKLPNLDGDLQKEASAGTVKISNNWNDIADWMEISPDVLNATIEEYNGFCDRGYDEIFAKQRRYLKPLRTPPYYATKCGGFMGVSHGGIKINHRMEVLDPRHDPIPGLYAVGNDAGGWQSDTYSIIFSGFALGFAINSGRIAGENIA